MEKDPCSGGGQSKNDGPYDSHDDDDAASRTRKSGAAAAEAAKKGKPNVKAELTSNTNPSSAATTSATMAVIPNKNVSVWTPLPVFVCYV